MNGETEVMQTETRVFKPAAIGRLITIPQDATASERILALEEESAKFMLLIEMARALSSEKELDAAMARIAAYTTTIVGCERSSVFLLDKQKGELYSLIAQGLDVKELRFSVNSGVAGYVAREQAGLNIPDAYKEPRFNPAVDKTTGYHTVSILCMPLLDRHGGTMGVLQCLNKKSNSSVPAVFTQKDEIVLSAVAAQSAVFLENGALRMRMDKLFDAFVEATSRSIDDRDPCTSGHSRRVTLYTLNLARAVHECQDPPFKEIVYTRDRMRQLRYAALLHDVGKIGVREHVLCKAQKLPTPAMQSIHHRLELIREKVRTDCLSRSLKEKQDYQKLLFAEFDPLSAEISAAIQLIDSANGSNFLNEVDALALEVLVKRGWLNSDEFNHLSVRRGNLTPEEWDDMRSHVTKSFRMLEQIPWPVELKDLPEVAYTHHEKYDGSGYPRKLKESEIHFDGHIMCVADIYDALTAADRPYKKAIPHERAEKILLEEEANRGRIMPDLVKLFFKKECYKIQPTSGISKV